MKNKKNKALNEFDLANWFLTNEPLTLKKLQKLVYYAQVWNLINFGEDIIKNIKFEAWVHGPVNKKIRNKYLDYAWNEIPLVDNDSKKQIECKFSQNQLTILKTVWKKYGKLTTDQLESLIHSEEPWKNARKGFQQLQACDKNIDNADIKKYYSSLIRK